MVFGTGCNNQRYFQFHLGESGKLSPGLITFANDSPLFRKNNKECICGTDDFLVRTHQNCILQGYLNNNINMLTQILHIHTYLCNTYFGHGCDRMVIRFTSTYSISGYHH